jgi:NAD(P)-dependent dehydrogenase (short-subunit alcohol dehydrogenase family)
VGLRIVLTGASRGLGRAMAAGFIAAGHTVIGCGTKLDLVNELRAQWGAPHRFDTVDVASDNEVRTWAALVLQDGPPDLLVNNAAVINPNAPLWQISVEDFDRVIDINIKGVANVIRHFVPAMVRRKKGVIVNFSSGWGRSVSPEVAPYCATKWAIEGLTQALAEELPAGMAAIPLNPGIINTDMLQSGFGAAASSYPSPERWAKKAVPFILRFGADDNGQPLTVPGV